MATLIVRPATPDDATELARLLALFDNRGATPSQIIEQMQPFVELGVDYFLLDCGGFPRLTTVELLIEEVLPALQH